MPEDASQEKIKGAAINLCMKAVHGSSVRVHGAFTKGLLKETCVPRDYNSKNNSK